MNIEQNYVAVAPDVGLPISELAEAAELPTGELSELCSKKEFATPKLTQPATLWSANLPKASLHSALLPEMFQP